MRLKALYMKHYNNTPPNLIMHYISHSTPPPPLHPHTRKHTHTRTHIHAVSQPLASPSLSQSLSTSLSPKLVSQPVKTSACMLLCCFNQMVKFGWDRLVKRLGDELLKLFQNLRRRGSKIGAKREPHAALQLFLVRCLALALTIAFKEGKERSGNEADSQFFGEN